MNRSLQECLSCIINGNDKQYTDWSTDVKLFPLSYNSQITTTLGMSPYEMVFNQKPRKPIIFTANFSKNTHGYCQPNKDSICHILPLLTDDEDQFHHPQISKLASGTHIEWILTRDKKHSELYQKVTKKIVTKIKYKYPNKFTIYTSYRLKKMNICSIFTTQKGISIKLQPLPKGPYQIIDKPTVQYRNNLLPYYPKEYALRNFTQLYFFTGLKVVQNNSDSKQNQNTDINSLIYKLDNKTPH